MKHITTIGFSLLRIRFVINFSSFRPWHRYMEFSICVGFHQKTSCEVTPVTQVLDGCLFQVACSNFSPLEHSFCFLKFHKILKWPPTIAVVNHFNYISPVYQNTLHPALYWKGQLQCFWCLESAIQGSEQCTDYRLKV